MEYNKILTANLQTISAPVPEELIIPVIQHIGRPAEPIVKKGDKVKKGQLIAKAGKGCSANVHSSVSGTITDIKSAPHQCGIAVESIIIKNDFEDTPIKLSPLSSIKNLGKKQIIDLVFNAGIVGLGGATFPTHIKLNPNKKVEELILNGAECEPYLTADHRLMIEDTKNIFAGIKILQKVLEPENIYIGVEDNKPDAILALRKLSIQYKNIHIITLPTSYPQGAEKVLVRQITGKRVKRLPIDAGVVVINVATAAQIADSIYTGMPLTERIVTVSGELLEKRQNLRVRIGTPIKHLLQEIEESPPQEPFKIISGGPMMGVAQHNLNVPVTKGTSGILVIPNYIHSEQSCIKCAKCIDNCPLYLMPIMAAKKGFQANECMECGLCSYNCPSNIQLVQRIRMQKTKHQIMMCKT